jgi:hypothetical protein
LTPCCHRRVKDASRRNRLENEARVFHEKLSLVQETRLEKREIERILADQRLLNRRAALEKKEEVRRAQELGGNVKAQEEGRKRQLAKDTYAEKVQQEVSARKELERELQRMAREETELIDRLRERQQEQHQVRAPEITSAQFASSPQHIIGVSGRCWACESTNCKLVPSNMQPCLALQYHRHMVL